MENIKPVTHCITKKIIFEHADKQNLVYKFPNVLYV